MLFSHICVTAVKETWVSASCFFVTPVFLYVCLTWFSLTGGSSSPSFHSIFCSLCNNTGVPLISISEMGWNRRPYSHHMKHASCSIKYPHCREAVNGCTAVTMGLYPQKQLGQTELDLLCPFHKNLTSGKLFFFILGSLCDDSLCRTLGCTRQAKTPFSALCFISSFEF